MDINMIGRERDNLSLCNDIMTCLFGGSWLCFF